MTVRVESRWMFDVHLALGPDSTLGEMVDRFSEKWYKVLMWERKGVEGERKDGEGFDPGNPWG